MTKVHLYRHCSSDEDPVTARGSRSMQREFLSPQVKPEQVLQDSTRWTPNLKEHSGYMELNLP